MKLNHHPSRIFFAIGIVTVAFAIAYASGGYLTTFRNTYPVASYPNVTPLNSCLLCHTGYPSTPASGNTVNSYGNAYANNGYSFSAIESLDSDGDGYSNIAEIMAGTFPGDASSHPASASSYTVGGSVSGLASGRTVVLQNNGGGNLSQSANGSFTFATALSSGAAYSVAVLTQPTGQTCSVTNGSGTISGANVTSVSVVCQNVTPVLPTITISTPTTSSTYATNSSPLSIGGTASSNAGISNVTWSNDTGGNGAATTGDSWATWSISGIALQSGVNVIAVTAIDAAGNSNTDTLTVTYNPPPGSGEDLSSMTIWEGKWFRVTISPINGGPSSTTNYLQIRSWDSNMRTLRARLYSRDSGRAGRQQTADLSLRYTSGIPLGFLFSFDYLRIFGISGSITGTLGSDGAFAKATLSASGIYLSHAAEEEADDTESSPNNAAITMRGALIPISQVPRQIQHPDNSD
jgi:hypothetical protein